MVEEEHEKPSGASRVSADTASGHQSVRKGVSVLWRAENTRHGSPRRHGRLSFSAGVNAASRRRRTPRAGSAPGEGAESTGSTTTHLRTTHDRERLCARSGCGRKNDVRHDDYPMPPSPEQCKPAMRPMMRASHRRITVEPIRGTDTEWL